jgi:hypothetical protein
MFLLPVSLAEQSRRRRHRTPNRSHRIKSIRLNWFQNKVRESMAQLILSPTRKHFRIGDKNDFVVLDAGRVIGRIFLNSQAPEGRPWWTITAPDIPPSNRQAGIQQHANKRWRISKLGG